MFGTLSSDKNIVCYNTVCPEMVEASTVGERPGMMKEVWSPCRIDNENSSNENF